MSVLVRSGVAAAAALLVAGSASAYTLTVDVSGIFSNDEFGSALNEVRSFDLFPNARIVGIGWDVTLFADSPSYLSEMSVDLSDGAGAGFSLSPGFGADNPGMQAFSSGIVDLIGLGTDFSVGAAGKLWLEFFEQFDDYAADWDGEWISGTLTIEYVPEPATFGLAALGLLGAGIAGRRRRTAAPADLTA